MWTARVDDASQELRFHGPDGLVRLWVDSGRLDRSEFELFRAFNRAAGKHMPSEWQVRFPVFWRGKPAKGKVLVLETPRGAAIVLEARQNPIPRSLNHQLRVVFMGAPDDIATLGREVRQEKEDAQGSAQSHVVPQALRRAGGGPLAR